MRVSAIHTYPIKGCRRIDHDSAVVEPWGLRHDRRWLITDPHGVAITQREVPRLGQLRAEPEPSGLRLAFAGQPTFAGQPPFGGQPTRLVKTMPAAPTAVGNVFGAVVAATPAGPEADAWISAVLGVQARLVWLDDPTRRPTEPSLSEPGDRVSFADEFPLLLTTTASLDRLNDWIAESGSDEGPLPMARFRPNIVIDGARPFQEDDWIGHTIRIGELEFRVPQACGRCVVTTTDQETGARGQEPLRTLGRYRNINQQLRFGVHLTPARPGLISVGDVLTSQLG